MRAVKTPLTIVLKSKALNIHVSLTRICVVGEEFPRNIDPIIALRILWDHHNICHEQEYTG